MTDIERQVAQQSQEKFQFYAVALAFTVLGLSIQTASFQGHIVGRVLELLSWASLLTSGLAGLYHLEWSPVLRMKMAQRDEMDEKAVHLQQQKERGTQQVNVVQSQKIVPIDEHIGQYKSYAATLEDIIKSIDAKSARSYNVFRWSFISGVFLLVVARAYNPLLNIVEDLCC